MSTTTKTYSNNATKLKYRKICSNASTITITGVCRHSQEITIEWTDFYKNYTSASTDKKGGV